MLSTSPSSLTAYLSVTLQQLLESLNIGFATALAIQLDVAIIPAGLKIILSHSRTLLSTNRDAHYSPTFDPLTILIRIHQYTTSNTIHVFSFPLGQVKWTAYSHLPLSLREIYQRTPGRFITPL